MTNPIGEPDAAGSGAYPCLILNADFQPLSYYPLSLWSWQDTIKAVFLERVNVVNHYDHVVRSPSFEMQLPSVVSLKDYVVQNCNPAFTRFNLFLRDEFTCQYCGSKGDMTFDHVVPRARGGRTTWENVVASCSPCNLHKGSRSLRRAGMKLYRTPKRPQASQLLNAGRKFPPNHLHHSWFDFLYWDGELES